MKKWLLRAALFLLALCLILAAALILYIRSDAFAKDVERRIVAEVERASGGTAEMRRFWFDGRALKAGVEGFVLHGKEPPGSTPLFAAKEIEAEIRILSFLSRRADLRAIRVRDPRIRIIADEKGNTNLPEPKIRRTDKRDFVDSLLDLKSGRIEVTGGWLEINDRRVPLDLKADDLAVALRYESAAPQYVGTAAAKDLTVTIDGFGPVRSNFEAETTLRHGSILVHKARMQGPLGTALVSGFAYNLLRPSADFGVNADISLEELSKLVQLPVAISGAASFAGKVALSLDKAFQYDLQGLLKGKSIALRQGSFAVRNASLQGTVSLNNERLLLTSAVLNALGGTFTGSAQMDRYDRYRADGRIDRFATNQVQLTGQPLPLSAIASGPVHIEGSVRTRTLDAVRAEITLAPAPEGRPLRGLVNLDLKGQTLSFTNSYLSTPESEAVFHGTLDRNIRAGLRTSNLDDVQLFVEQKLPVQLRNGSISFDGSLTGSTLDPIVHGRAQANNVVYEGQLVDRIAADIDLRRNRLEARGVSLDQAKLHVAGQGEIALTDWKALPNSALRATGELTGASIGKLLRDAGRQDLPITGDLGATVQLNGSLESLAAEARFTAERVVAYDEPVQSIRGALTNTSTGLEVTAGLLEMARTRIPFTLRYQKSPGADWTNGVLHWKLQGNQVDLASIHNFRSRIPDISGLAAIQSDGEARIVDSVFQLRYLQGEASAPSIAYRNSTIENLQLRAATKGVAMGVTGRAMFQGARLRLTSEWMLEGKAPGEGIVTVAGGSLESLAGLFSNTGGKPMAFQSAVEGEARFKVSLLDPGAFESDILLRRIQINPAPTQVLRGGAKEQDLVVMNLRPVTLHLNAKEAAIQTAQFAATNTRLDVTGRIGFGEKAAWDLKLMGSLNMAELQILNKDLLATGVARVDATIKGGLENPLVNGNLQLNNTSLYFGELPTGLDNVNGSVLFDRNRATVQSLTGESGGGKFSLTGFVGFGGPALVYRLQAAATGVRVRYPEGASTTVNANLNLTGTSEDSLLGGTISIARAGFNPRTDFASILADTAKSNSPSTPVTNEYIRGMQFDLRIESAPNLEFQTSLTRGLRAEVDLRLRGNLARPSLLGNVSFSEGEIALFGNKYTLNRGDIRFFNPTRIEPTFDLEAETRARGITVNVSFSGTPSKINSAYRSDPPLQPSEIIALLAIGRDPNIGAGLATSQSNTQSTLQGVGSLVGEAVASSLNGRLQKFFGVTRIKIDPQLTGVENIPQARLTLEQQVSKDITLTYITNLARTQEQIVRIQWDISKQWSAIALREENGLFGIDFQYRKRFK
jgi:translocation and assembly module TamB